jgi:exonuclease-1
MGLDDEAKKYFARSLVLRTKMIDLLIDILKCLDVEFVIAPYEADAQIAYMVKNGIADFSISEDSDLIAFGCPKTVMKLGFTGQCKVFSLEDFRSNKAIDEKNLKFLQTLS